MCFTVARVTEEEQVKANMEIMRQCADEDCSYDGPSNLNNLRSVALVPSFEDHFASKLEHVLRAESNRERAGVAKCIEKLAAGSNAKAVELLARSLEQDTETGCMGWDAKKTILTLLRKVAIRGDERALQATFRSINEFDASVRRAAAQALGALAPVANEEAVRALAGRLGDIDGDVRKAAVEALGDLGDATTAELLVSLVADGSCSVRRAAVDALGAVAARSRAPHAAVSALLPLLHDGDSGVRRAAAEALGAAQPQRCEGRAVQALASLLQRPSGAEPEADVRRAVAAALGRAAPRGLARAAGALRAVLGAEPDAGVRWAAAVALAAVASGDDAETAAALSRCLADSDRFVRMAAARALDALAASKPESAA